MQCTYSIKLLKYKLIYWLFILKMAISSLKMAISSPKMVKKWHFCAINIFFPVGWYMHPCLRSTQFIGIRIFYEIGSLWVNFLAFYPENGHFLTKNGQKIASFGRKLLFFVRQHLRPCLISTLVIWYGPYCIIGEVLVDLLPFF